MNTRKTLVYLKRTLGIIPSQFAEYDLSRLTVAFFAVGATDILNGELENDRKSLVDWIYSLQLVDQPYAGFRGSLAMAVEGDYDGSHIAMTYSALLSLLILNDDLSRVKRREILQSLTALQQPDGSFRCVHLSSESDMRFVYCACVICTVLDCFSTIDVDRLTAYILKSQNYDGGFAQKPDLESHGGSTYCAVASLHLMDKLSSLPVKNLNRLLRWCVMRQQSGFNGRPNKEPDCCYSFWIGATLAILNHFDKSDREKNAKFLLECQDVERGGFGKVPEALSDPLHTYFGIAAFALLGQFGTAALEPSLNIAQRHFHRMKEIHKSWQSL